MPAVGSFYFSWRNSDGADVPVSEILSDTFITLSADSLGIFFVATRNVALYSAVIRATSLPK